jgi:hypothetical protein
MWTSIRSRMGSALTVVAVLLTMTLVVAAILFVVQRVFPAQGHRFQSYELEVSPAAPWHPGQSLSLVWVPTDAGIDPDTPLAHVPVLALRLLRHAGRRASGP